MPKTHTNRKKPETLTEKKARRESEKRSRKESSAQKSSDGSFGSFMEDDPDYNSKPLHMSHRELRKYITEVHRNRPVKKNPGTIEEQISALKLQEKQERLVNSIRNRSARRTSAVEKSQRAHSERKSKTHRKTSSGGKNKKTRKRH